MDLEKAKKLIRSLPNNTKYIIKCDTAERYLKCDNDILYQDKIRKPWVGKTSLREANNRVASSFFNYLEYQKTSFLVGKKVKFDTGSAAYNDAIDTVLGGHWAKTCKQLVMNAGLFEVAWLHSWVEEDGKFHYGVVDSRQITPIWGDTLNNKLLLLIRSYSYIDTEGDGYDVYEIWDDNYCYAYERKQNSPRNELYERKCFPNYNPDLNDEFTNIYEHGFSEIPFSAFYNNQFHMNDLEQIKGYIDTYDKAFSLFADNLEDVQQVIFVLENLGGTSTQEFLQRLRQEKCVKVVNNDDMKTDVRTLTIEIPTEASTALMDLARKNIFEQGQGVDPSPTSYAGNTSGEALKYMYANLELKATATEDEFRIGFDHFLKLVCEYLNIQVDNINQIWTRTRINNETEIINNIRNSEMIISRRTQLAMHPWVEDPDDELQQIEEEKESGIYESAFPVMAEEDEEEANAS